MYLARTPAPNVTAVVSIHGRREFAVPSAPGVPRLDLAFDDVDVPGPNDDVGQIRAGARRRWAAENGLTETAPTPADAAALVAFARAIQGNGGVVLCHCGAGMSRAPAAALILLATWRGPGTEADAHPRCAACARPRRLTRGLFVSRTASSSGKGNCSVRCAGSGTTARGVCGGE